MMALSAESSQLQSGDKLVSEPFLMTENIFFTHFMQFLSCFTAYQKSIATQPLTVWMATPSMRKF